MGLRISPVKLLISFTVFICLSFLQAKGMTYCCDALGQSTSVTVSVSPTPIPSSVSMTTTSSMSTAVVSTGGTTPVITPSPTPLYTPCNGEYSSSTSLPMDSVFEVVLDNTGGFGMSEVAMFVGELEMYLDSYCILSMRDSNISYLFSCEYLSNDNSTITEQLSVVYTCSTGDSQLILGLVYANSEGVLNASSAISSIGDDPTNAFSGYTIAARNATQVPSMVATTREPTTQPAGLTTDQIIGIAVGVAAGCVLVGLLSTIIVVLCCISDKKKKELTVTPVKNGTEMSPASDTRGISPSAVSHGSTDKRDSLPKADS